MELKLKRNGKWSKRLVKLPESGMGYQIVDITLKDGRVMKEVIVFNCESIYLPTGHENVCEKDIAEIKMSEHIRNQNI